MKWQSVIEMAKSVMLVFVVPIVPIVKDQSRVAGSANLPSGNTAVSTASMITGESTRKCHEVIILPRNLDKTFMATSLLIQNVFLLLQTKYLIPYVCNCDFICSYFILPTYWGLGAEFYNKVHGEATCFLISPQFNQIINATDLEVRTKANFRVVVNALQILQSCFLVQLWSCTM